MKQEDLKLSHTNWNQYDTSNTTKNEQKHR